MYLRNLKSNFWLLLPISFIGTWPPLSMFILVLAFIVNLTKVGFYKVCKLYFISFICMLVILTMSFLSSAYNGESIFDAKNFKFLFYLIALTYGYSLNKVNYKNSCFLFFIVFCILLIAQYLMFGWSSDSREGSAFYLPDQNNSMIIISFLFPVVLSFSTKSIKFFVITLTLVCMFIIGSRAGFALVGAVLIFYSVNNLMVIYRLFLAVLVALVAFYYDVGFNYFASVTEFNSYSDQVRLTLWKVGTEKFFSHENLFFGMGYDFFDIYNHFLSNDMKHVHNIYLQVLFTTGVLGGGAILLFFISWLYFSFKQGNTVLFLQVVIVVLLGLVETVYSDSRVFVVICYFLGLSYRNFTSVNKEY